MSDERRDLPPAGSPAFLERVREVLSTYLGKRGDEADRGVTLRDLQDAGASMGRDSRGKLTVKKVGGTGSGLPGPKGDKGDPGDNSIYTPDLTPPPTPSGTSVIAGIAMLNFQTASATYTQGHGHSRTRVYGATWTTGPKPTFSSAVRITEFTGNIFAHPTTPATTWHIWFTWVTNDGVESAIAAPSGLVNGHEVTTGQDVSLLLTALTGQIRQSELATALGARIDLIDAAATTPGSVAARIKVESDNRATLDGNVRALYTVRAEVSAGGRTVVGGFGLAGTASAAQGPRIDFGVRADTFFVEAPSGGSNPTAKMTPFVIRTSETTENGVVIPAGVYIDAAYIINLTATYAKIQSLVADQITAADIAVSKLTAGVLKVGSYIQSADYTAGASGAGYKISRDGVELPSTAIRGQLTASQVDTRGLSIKDGSGNIILAAGTPLAASNITPAAGWLNSNVGGVNMVWGPGNGLISAGPGAYGAWIAELKNGTNNPHSLLPGEALTLSADVWQDAASAGVGQTSTVILYCDGPGGWFENVSVWSSSLSRERKSASLTLPTDPNRMVTVSVSVYHQNGSTGNLTGTVYADRVQVERGGTATQYKPGAQPGATVGAQLGTNLKDSGGTVLGDSAVKNTAITIAADGTLSGGGGGQVTIPGLGQTSYRVVSVGGSATTAPAGAGIYLNGSSTAAYGSARSYIMIRIRRSDGAVVWGPQTYDVFGNGALTDGRNAATLAADLNATGGDTIVVVWTADEPRDNRTAGGLPAAMYRCGASRAVFGSANFQYRGAYVLVGIGGCGEGNGVEAYQGAVISDPNAWCDLTFTLTKGVITGVSSTFTPKSLSDYGYVGDLDATKNRSDADTNTAISDAQTAATNAAAAAVQARIDANQIYAAAVADGKVTAAEQRAIDAAQTKANAAQAEAVRLAAIDATTKANAAALTADVNSLSGAMAQNRWDVMMTTARISAAQIGALNVGLISTAINGGLSGDRVQIDTNSITIIKNGAVRVRIAS